MKVTEMEQVFRYHVVLNREEKEIGGVLGIAIMIGKHWRDQDGVNGSLMEELAERTAALKLQPEPRRPS